MKVTVRDDLKRLRAELTATAAHLERANRSALSSIGNVIRLALARYIRIGGEGWKPRNEITRRMSITDTGEAIYKSRAGTDRPYLWLAKYTRYRVEDAGARVRAGFGKSHARAGSTARSTAGQSGTFDNFLESVVQRAESGERIRVTDKMRRMMGAATSANRRKGGWSFRKDTHTIFVPKRPIFAPVYRRLEPQIGPLYRAKFFAALERYQSRAKKSFTDRPSDLAASLLGDL